MSSIDKGWPAYALQNIHVAIVVHSADTSILASNAMAQQVLGLTEDQLLGKTAIDPAWHFLRQDGSVMPVEEYPVNQVLASGQPLRDMMASVHCPDREQATWVLVNAEPVSDDSGKIEQVIVTFVDITRRRRAEDELRISERRYRMSQNVGHVGNWEYDLQTAKFWGSDEAKRLYGFDPLSPDFSTEEVENCIPERERVHQALLDLIERDKPYDLEFEIRPRDSNESRFVSSMAELKRDHEGKPLVVVGVIHDITARKRAEARILQFNQELEDRVAARTAELRSANQELEAFAYSVSHDLRAPLRHMNCFVGMLERRAAHVLDPQSLHYMKTIAQAADRLGILIDGLLGFSRMGRHEMHTCPTDLNLLFSEALCDLEAETRGRTVVWNLAELPVVKVDAAMIRIVIDNLLANALKFTRTRPRAEISVGRAAGEPGRAVIFVRDNGVGFDGRYVDKLFRVFQRLHHTDEFEGTGIGLANVRRIIERHGGSAWAEGSPGEGATFYFSLPT